MNCQKCQILIWNLFYFSSSRNCLNSGQLRKCDACPRATTLEDREPLIYVVRLGETWRGLFP